MMLVSPNVCDKEISVLISEKPPMSSAACSGLCGVERGLRYVTTNILQDPLDTININRYVQFASSNTIEPTHLTKKSFS